MKIGFFGGTFSPPHNGHLKILNAATSQFGLDRVFLLPNGTPPHKEIDGDKEDRLNMCKIAFASADKVEVSDFECLSEDKSYTYLTLDHFRALYPDDEFFLIVGADSLKTFPTWRHPEKIAQTATLLGASRKGDDFETASARAESVGATVKRLACVADDVSSTEIRLRYQFGLPPKDVNAQVDKYIRRKELYEEYRPWTMVLETMLTEKRYMHSFYTTLAGLQLDSGCDREKVFLACALHDCAKYIEPSDYAKYDYTAGDKPESVNHAFLGALVAKKSFGVVDEEILSAIKYHTTAKPAMTTLEKVVYVADKIEKSRDYPVEHLLRPTLDETFVEVLKEAYSVCKQKGNKIYPLTEQALAYYTEGENNG